MRLYFGSILPSPLRSGLRGFIGFFKLGAARPRLVERLGERHFFERERGKAPVEGVELFNRHALPENGRIPALDFFFAPAPPGVKRLRLFFEGALRFLNALPR